MSTSSVEDHSGVGVESRVARRRAANRARIETRERAATIAHENAVCWCGHLRVSHTRPYRGEPDDHTAPCWRCAEGEWDLHGTVRCGAVPPDRAMVTDGQHRHHQVVMP